MNLRLLGLAGLVALAGCANPNLVGQRGNDLNGTYSLQDRRAAKLAVKVTPSIPAGSQVLGTLEAKRCHQYMNQDAPSNTVLLDDLVLQAYAQGADGISDVAYASESGLLSNCWQIAKAKATYYQRGK